jgi:hypothetical protein
MTPRVLRQVAEAKFSFALRRKDSFSGFAVFPHAAFHASPSQGNIKAIDFQRLVARGWFGLFSRPFTLGFRWVNSTHFR